MKNFSERRERIEIEEDVLIPALDGATIAETIKVKVPAWRDPKDGEIYLDGEALRIIDRVKARHMGLLTPEQIKSLRERLGLTQKQISELLQIGEKTWTRWENGRERPFRSINVLLCALRDGKIDLAYLCSLAKQRNDWASRLFQAAGAIKNPWSNTVQRIWQDWEPEAGRELTAALHQAIAKVILSRAAVQGSLGIKVETKVTIYPQLQPNVIPVRFAQLPATTSPPKPEQPTPIIENERESLAA
jgi:DNA-binding transcriptional regulator YiaG